MHIIMPMHVCTGRYPSSHILHGVHAMHALLSSAYRYPAGAQVLNIRSLGHKR